MAGSQDELGNEVRDLRKFVQDYRPGNTVTVPDKIDFPKNLFIGLFGRTGCGKSSLINSLKFATHGKLRRARWVEVASQEKAGGHTMFRKCADLTQAIFVVDNRGLDNPKMEEALAEIAAQLDGRRGYSEVVQWSGPVGDEGQRVDAPGIDLRTGHPISCAVFVFSAIHDLASNVAGLNDVVDFLHSHEGRYPVAVITHVDVVERKTVDTLATVLRVAGVSDIYEVANITPEKTRLEEQYQLNLLTLIERCITVGDETVVFKHYQRVEMEKKMQIRKLNQKAVEERRRSAENYGGACDSNGDELPGTEATDDQGPEGQEKNQQGWKTLEDERARVDKLKLDLERRQLELEFQERERAFRADLERQQREMEEERKKLENREKELQEQERERRFQEALQKIEADKQRELMSIREANRSQPHGGHAPLVGCRLQ